MLNSDSRPTKPAAMPAIAACCAGVSAVPRATPISEGPNTSCSIGEATEITPMPALTFSISTVQISQNCGVFQARFRCTCPAAIIRFAAGGVQPAGCQPAGGTR